MQIDLEAERKEILNRYKLLLKACKRRLEKGDKEIVRKAFEVAVEAHKEMRRKSGEPYIYHPIAVAQICAEEIGLGTTGIVCALLHDTVEDTDLTLDDIKGLFGEKVSQIIDGLTKISGVIDNTSSLQAENFRKGSCGTGNEPIVASIRSTPRRAAPWRRSAPPSPSRACGAC